MYNSWIPICPLPLSPTTEGTLALISSGTNLIRVVVLQQIRGFGELVVSLIIELLALVLRGGLFFPGSRNLDPVRFCAINLSGEGHSVNC